MNKEKYLDQLRKLLRNLPQEEIDSAIEYVDEYFEEAGGENFETAYNDLGSPQKFAAQIRAEHTIRQKTENQSFVQTGTKQQSQKHSGWVILVGILSLPLSFPVLVVVLAMILCGILLAALPIFILIVTIAVLFIVLIVMIQIAFKIISISLVSALLILAGILILTALICLATAALIALVGKIIPWFSNMLGKMYNRLKGENSHDMLD